MTTWKAAQSFDNIFEAYNRVCIFGISSGTAKHGLDVDNLRSQNTDTGSEGAESLECDKKSCEIL